MYECMHAREQEPIYILAEIHAADAVPGRPLPVISLPAKRHD